MSSHLYPIPFASRIRGTGRWVWFNGPGFESLGNIFRKLTNSCLVWESRVTANPHLARFLCMWYLGRSARSLTLDGPGSSTRWLSEGSSPASLAIIYILAEEKRIFRFEVGNCLPASRRNDLRSRLMNILPLPVAQDTHPCFLSIRHQRSCPSQTSCVEYKSARKGTTRIKIPPIKRE